MFNSMKNFRNGRSLHVENLENRQLLSVNCVAPVSDASVDFIQEAPADFNRVDKNDVVEGIEGENEGKPEGKPEGSYKPGKPSWNNNWNNNWNNDEAEAILKEIETTTSTVTFKVMNYDSDFKGTPSLDAPESVTVTFSPKRGVSVTEILNKVDVTDEEGNVTSTKWQSVDKDGVEKEDAQVSMNGDLITISGLQSNTKYEVSVEFEDTDETEVKVTTDKVKYDTPVNVTCTVNPKDADSSVIVTWQMEDDGDRADRGDSPTEGFTVTIVDAESGKKVKTVKTSDDIRANRDGVYSITVKGLDDGESYYAVVKANESKAFDDSDYSKKSSSVTTMGQLPKADLEVDATDNDVFIEVENMEDFRKADTLTIFAGKDVVKLKKTVAEDGTVSWDWADGSITTQVDFVDGDTFVFTDVEFLKPDTDYEASLIFSGENLISRKATSFDFETDEAAYDALEGSAITVRWVGKDEIAVAVDTSTTKANKFEATVYDAKGDKIEDKTFKGGYTTLDDNDMSPKGDFFVTVKCEDSGKFDDSKESIPVYTKAAELELEHASNLTYNVTGFDFSDVTGGFLNFNYTTVDAEGNVLVDTDIKVELKNLEGLNIGTFVIDEETGAGVQVKVDMANKTVTVTPHDYLNYGTSTLTLNGGYYEVAKETGHFRNYAGYWTAGENNSFSFTSGNDDIKLA